MKKKLKLIVLISGLLFFANAHAQFPPEVFDLPTVSPRATITQRIGVTTITIDYGRPAVKGRKIWNNFIVPYDGKPYPWRAGADENTTISFSNAVRIDGKDIGAGTYGLHALPSGNGEWTFALSKNAKAWGSFFYKQEDDVVRIKAKIDSISHQEWMRFDFLEPKNTATASSATIALEWEKVRASFLVEEDTKTYVLAGMRNTLSGLGGFSWLDWCLAAEYCSQNNFNLEEALQWASRSVNSGMNWRSVNAKADIQEQLGKIEEAKKTRELALQVANPAELYSAGRSALGRKNVDKAMEYFQLNLKKNGESMWQITDGLARVYSAKADFKNALKYAKLTAANPQVSEASKKFWEGAIKKLEENKPIEEIRIGG